jgi:FkbM family methyltransferase
MDTRSLRRLIWRVGRQLYVTARGEQRSGHISENGEADLQRCVLDAVPIGTPLRVCDIGANQGEWSWSLLKQASAERLSHGRLHVDAFEPVPGTAARLAETIKAWRGGQCMHLHALAMSNAPGEAQMAVMSDTGGTNTLHYDGVAKMIGTCNVRLETLANFCAAENIAHIHLVKCDTEGHDSKVIIGARPLLLEQRIDVLQFEYNHRWTLARSYLRDVFEMIAGLPYKLGRLRCNGRIDIFEEWHPELERFFESNYVLVRVPALAWFDAYYGTFDQSNTYA